MSDGTLDTRRYWESRLTAAPNLRGTGHRAFGLAYNQWLYQAQVDCVDQLLARQKIDLTNRRVLDVGSGTGFYIDYFIRQGANPIIGSDITEISTRYLQAKYPQHTFLTCDVSAQTLPLTGDFFMISCVSVLYHILQQAQFETALKNLCQHLAPGGYLLLSDTFRQPILPSAGHACFRPLSVYAGILAQYQLQIVEVMPLYYLLNRVFAPLLGPFVIDRLQGGAWLYRFDHWLRKQHLDNGSGMKLLLARREAV